MTRTARDKARRRYRQAAKSAPLRPNCPTPNKRSYPDEAVAIHVALNSSTKIGRPVSIYQCICGFNHLTKKRAR